MNGNVKCLMKAYHLIKSPAALFWWINSEKGPKYWIKFSPSSQEGSGVSPDEEKHGNNATSTAGEQSEPPQLHDQNNTHRTAQLWSKVSPINKSSGVALNGTVLGGWSQDAPSGPRSVRRVPAVRPRSISSPTRRLRSDARSDRAGFYSREPGGCRDEPIALKTCASVPVCSQDATAA